MAYPLSTNSTNSASSDKLGMLCEHAQKILKDNPILAERVSKVTIVWVEIDDAVVPNVEIVFFDSSIQKHSFPQLPSLDKNTNSI